MFCPASGRVSGTHRVCSLKGGGKQSRALGDRSQRNPRMQLAPAGAGARSNPDIFCTRARQWPDSRLQRGLRVCAASSKNDGESRGKKRAKQPGQFEVKVRRTVFSLTKLLNLMIEPPLFMPPPSQGGVKTKCVLLICAGFPEQVVTPPSRSLGVHALPANTHCGECAAALPHFRPAISERT